MNHQLFVAGAFIFNTATVTKNDRGEKRGARYALHSIANWHRKLH